MWGNMTAGEADEVSNYQMKAPADGTHTDIYFGAGR